MTSMASAPRTVDVQGATTFHGPPVSCISTRTSPGYKGKKAHAFSTTAPDPSTGRVDGYPARLMLSYHPPSYQVATNV